MNASRDAGTGGTRATRGALTRLVTVLVVATAVSALSSVITASLAVVSHLEARALRTELDAKWAMITKPTTALSDEQRDRWFRETEPPSIATWDALPATEPITVPRALVDGVVAGATGNSARIVPAFENGRNIGFKLFGIKHDSVYAELGIQNGDTVRRVNGHDLTSPDAALAAYAALKDETKFRVDISRRGQAVRLDYVVTADGGSEAPR